jgi:hypothetical protein
MEREKILFIALVAVIVVALGIPQFNQWIIEPIEQRIARLQLLDSQVSDKQLQEIAILKSRREMAHWKARSLPPDPLDAQRLYQEWLTDLARIAGLTDAKVTPEPRIGRGDVFVPVRISIEVNATFEHLCRFLFLFHQTDLMHRIAELQVDSEQNEGNPPLKISLTAEGLALVNASPRDRLFPQTQSLQELSADATEIEVAGNDGFPESGTFRIRLGNEFVNVSKISGMTWTLVRGVDSTEAMSHELGATVELAPVDQSLPRATLEDYSTIVANSLFVKPIPKGQSLPELKPIGPQRVYALKTLSFTAEVAETSGAEQKLKFSLAEGAPAGASIDASTGLFSWTPDTSVTAGEHECTVVVEVTDLPRLKASETFKITVGADAADQTTLSGIVGQNDRWKAFLTNNAEKKNSTEVYEGSTVSVADIEAVVEQIGRHHIVVKMGGDRWRLNLGKSLRSMQKLPAANDAQEETNESESSTP